MNELPLADWPVPLLLDALEAGWLVSGPDEEDEYLLLRLAPGRHDAQTAFA